VNITRNEGGRVIYDPTDKDMALREDLVLMHRVVFEGEANGKRTGTVEQWVPLHEVFKASNRPDDFTRPSW